MMSSYTEVKQKYLKRGWDSCVMLEYVKAAAYSSLKVLQLESFPHSFHASLISLDPLVTVYEKVKSTQKQVITRRKSV